MDRLGVLFLIISLAGLGLACIGFVFLRIKNKQLIAQLFQAQALRDDSTRQLEAVLNFTRFDSWQRKNSFQPRRIELLQTTAEEIWRVIHDSIQMAEVEYKTLFGERNRSSMKLTGCARWFVRVMKRFRVHTRMLVK
jgi:hypothetical protein